jgi:hypothetical protein
LNENVNDSIDNTEELNKNDNNDKSDANFLLKSVKDKAFLLIVDFKSKNQLSNSMLHYVLAQFNDYFNGIITIIINQAVSILSVDNNKESLETFCKNSKNLKNTFDSLDTNYKQEKEIVKTGMFVKPQSIYLKESTPNLETMKIFKLLRK